MNLMRLVLVVAAVVVVFVIVVVVAVVDAYSGPYQDFVLLSFQSASAVAA